MEGKIGKLFRISQRIFSGNTIGINLAVESCIKHISHCSAPDHLLQHYILV